jgi:hypothetical protein
VKLSRPFGVWVVTIYIGISVVFNLVAVVSTDLGMIPLDKSPQAYVRLTVLDQGMIAMLLFLSIVKGIALFRLKKYAFGLFLLAFIINGAFLIFRGHAMRDRAPAWWRDHPVYQPSDRFRDFAVRLDVVLKGNSETPVAGSMSEMGFIANIERG